ncbi:hypothetical protein [Halorhabdus rudnickae]|uniref:hypothetical protein n=1 Tax=Halorhabdus rudnickae TaxID=1775544 RepID=UPI001082C107|nr:hypothetical protein [Halorhabdus rudnickae]
MDIGRADIAMFVYNTATVMSGAYVAITIGIEDTMVMLPVAIGLGFAWTVYYHVSMASLLEDIRTGDLIPDDKSEANTDSNMGDTESETEPLEDDGEYRGAKPPWSQE